MSNVIGLVIQADQGLNEDYIVSTVADLRPRSVVVINSGKVAEKIQPYCGQVICRIKTDQYNDDNFDLNIRDVRGFVRKLHDESPPGALLYAGNECGVRTSHLNATDVFMDEAEVLNRRAVIHNWSVGYPSNIRSLDMYEPNFKRAFVGKHLFGTHDAYFDRGWNTPILPRFLYLRDTLMQGRFPEVVMTEGGCCFNYEAYRGYRWGDYPLTDEQHAGELIEQAKWLQPHGVSVCIFIMSREYPENQWIHFIPRQRVYDELKAKPVEWKAYMPPVTEPQPCDFTPGVVTTTPQGFVNIRSFPNSRAPKLGELRAGDSVLFCEEQITENGYRWWRLKTGYAAAANAATGGVISTIVAGTPAPPFTLQTPFTWEAVITSRFNDVRDYGKHEGVDFAPASSVKRQALQILAAADGVVESVRDFPGAKAAGKLTDGYGMYVRLSHTHAGQVYKTWYAHLGVPLVAVGEVVKAGDVIGLLGTSGSSTGYHVHLTVQHIGHGLSGYAVDDVIDPMPLLVEG